MATAIDEKKSSENVFNVFNDVDRNSQILFDSSRKFMSDILNSLRSHSLNLEGLENSIPTLIDIYYYHYLTYLTIAEKQSRSFFEYGDLLFSLHFTFISELFVNITNELPKDPLSNIIEKSSSTFDSLINVLYSSHAITQPTNPSKNSPQFEKEVESKKTRILNLNRKFTEFLKSKLIDRKTKTVQWTSFYIDLDKFFKKLSVGLKKTIIWDEDTMYNCLEEQTLNANSKKRVDNFASKYYKLLEIIYKGQRENKSSELFLFLERALDSNGRYAPLKELDNLKHKSCGPERKKEPLEKPLATYYVSKTLNMLKIVLSLQIEKDSAFVRYLVDVTGVEYKSFFFTGPLPNEEEFKDCLNFSNSQNRSPRSLTSQQENQNSSQPIDVRDIYGKSYKEFESFEGEYFEEGPSNSPKHRSISEDFMEESEEEASIDRGDKRLEGSKPKSIYNETPQESSIKTGQGGNREGDRKEMLSQNTYQSIFFGNVIKADSTYIGETDNNKENEGEKERNKKVEIVPEDNSFKEVLQNEAEGHRQEMSINAQSQNSSFNKSPNRLSNSRSRIVSPPNIVSDFYDHLEVDKDSGKSQHSSKDSIKTPSISGDSFFDKNKNNKINFKPKLNNKISFFNINGSTENTTEVIEGHGNEKKFGIKLGNSKKGVQEEEVSEKVLSKKENVSDKAGSPYSIKKFIKKKNASLKVKKILLKNTEPEVEKSIIKKKKDQMAMDPIEVKKESFLKEPSSNIQSKNCLTMSPHRIPTSISAPDIKFKNSPSEANPEKNNSLSLNSRSLGIFINRKFFGVESEELNYLKRQMIAYIYSRTQREFSEVNEIVITGFEFLIDNFSTKTPIKRGKECISEKKKMGKGKEEFAKVKFIDSDSDELYLKKKKT